MDRSNDDTAKVVFLRPPTATTAPEVEVGRARVAAGAAAAFSAARRTTGKTLTFMLLAAWQVVRVAICALLVLIEPLLRVTLVPLAFLGFVVTLLFGFLMQAPNFPKWGMLSFSVGLVIVYWLFLGFMSLFMRLPPDHDRYR